MDPADLNRHMPDEKDGPKPSLRGAIVAPFVVALGLAVWVHASWEGPCTHPPGHISSPFTGPEVFLGVPAILTALYAWHRGQPFSVIVGQALLSVPVTVLFCAIAIYSGGNTVACGS